MSIMNGLVRGKVVSEPDDLGRVKVRIPFLGENSETYYAPIATFMAGKERGAWIIPEVDDDVVIGFEQGNVEQPIILGFIWNGQNMPPSGDRHERTIHSANGHTITLYDPDVSQGDQGFIRIEDAHGNRIELTNAMLSIKGISIITIDAPTVLINKRLVSLSPSLI
jgi:uncharacterized protein involved in type VI secretion and phage assembly